MIESQLAVGLNGADYPLELIGGKAASLSRLRSFGAPVPAAVALTTESYRLHTRQLGIPDRASAVAVTELPGIRAAILECEPPPEVLEAIEASISAVAPLASGDGLLAVRSSATTEDSPEFSFAGLHDTALSVPADIDAVKRSVLACWASLWSDRSVDYRRRGGEALDGSAMGVVIQQLIRADVSFVAFTVDPVHGCARHTIISASFGLGETIVAGLVRPDHIVIGPDRLVHSYDIGSKETMVIPDGNGAGGVRQVAVPHLLARQQCMSFEQAVSIAEMARSIEDAFQMPLDVEGGIANGQIYFFQARPITTCQVAPEGSSDG